MMLLPARGLQHPPRAARLSVLRHLRVSGLRFSVSFPVSWRDVRLGFGG